MAAAQDYDVPDQGKEIFNGMADQWEKGDLCDIQLEAEGQTLRCHRNILAASSPYFHSMFIGNFKESKQKKVNLKGVNFDALRTIVKCIYYQKIEITNENVQEVLSMAHLFQMSSIIEICEKYMIENLSIANCFTYKKLFEKFSMLSGDDAVNEYIMEKFVALTKSEDFLELPKETLCLYLQHESLGVSEEIEAFRIAKAWLEHDKERLKYCYDIMKQISFAFIPTDVLKDEVRSASFMQQDKDCNDLLFETLSYHANIYTQPMYRGTINRPKGKPSLFVIESGTLKVKPPGGKMFKIQEAENPAWIVKLDNLHEKHIDVKVGIPFVYDSISLVEYNNFLYLFGVDNRSFSGVSMRYDGNTNKWIDLAPIPSGSLVKSAVSRIGETIIVTGGQGVSPNDKYKFYLGRLFDETHLYDIASNTWKRGTSFPHSMTAATGCTLNDFMYVAGGQVTEQQWTKKMWAYDVRGNLWLAKADMNVERQNPMMEAIKDGLVLTDTRFKSVEFYNSHQDQWTMIDVNENFHLKECTAFAYDDALHFLGGAPKDNRIGYVDKNGDWTQVETKLFKDVGRTSCAILRIK